jgi:peptide/nickel transport system ATP-binding protein/oligopeptide transport system ATP-binding protein
VIGEDVVLEVRNLRTSFAVNGREVDAVRDVSFDIRKGEVLGLIGESGSGKTVTGLSVLRMLPAHATSEAKVLRYRGGDLAALSDSQFRDLRGVSLAMIFQDPVGSFNPAKTVGWHLRQAVERRGGSGAKAGWEEEARSLLADVGIRAPERVLASYPHQLSGGMLQRALIAMVIALRPTLIVADEPTTNLDNLVERQILDLIRLHQQRIGASVLFVTHDLSIAGEICDRIAVMYAGEIMEIGPAAEVLERPLHPYSAALLATSASLERRDEYLYELPGEPGAGGEAKGCRFAARCPKVMDRCRAVHPAMVEPSPGHQVRCILYGS